MTGAPSGSTGPTTHAALRHEFETSPEVERLEFTHVVTTSGSPLELMWTRQRAFQSYNHRTRFFAPGIGRMEGEDRRLVLDYGEGRRTIRAPVRGYHVGATTVDLDLEQTGPTELIIPVIAFHDLDALLGFAPGTTERGVEPLFDVVEYDPTVDLLARRMWAASVEHGPAAGLFLEQGVMTLALAMLERARGRGFAPDGPDGRARPGGIGDLVQAEVGRAGTLSPALARVVDFVEANLDAPLSLGDMATVGAMSGATLVRAFRTQTGQTPHRYLQARRIAHAKALLRGSRLSVAEIAHACGFASPAHFSRRFRAETGVAPRAWAAAARGDA